METANPNESEEEIITEETSLAERAYEMDFDDDLGEEDEGLGALRKN